MSHEQSIYRSRVRDVRIARHLAQSTQDDLDAIGRFTPEEIRNLGVCALVSLSLCYGSERVYLSELAELRDPEQLFAKVSDLNIYHGLQTAIPLNSSAFSRLMETVARGALIILNNRRSSDDHIVGVIPSWIVDDGTVTEERVYYVVDTAASRTDLLETDREGLSALYAEAFLTSSGQRAVFVLLDAKTTTTSDV